MNIALRINNLSFFLCNEISVKVWEYKNALIEQKELLAIKDNKMVFMKVKWIALPFSSSLVSANQYAFPNLSNHFQ